MTEQQLLDEIANRKFVTQCVRRALKQAGLTSDGFANIMKRRDRLVSEVAVRLRKLAQPDRFAGEQVASLCGYPANHRYVNVRQQLDSLKNFLVEPVAYSIDEGYLQTYRRIPGFRLFAIPRWQLFADTYGQAVRRACTYLTVSQRKTNLVFAVNDLFDWDSIQRGEEVEHAVTRLARQQGNKDVVLIPANFGRVYKGKSVNRALELMRSNEFGLGAFEAAMMLLTHPTRFASYKDLWMYCAGDTYQGEHKGAPVSVPCFYANPAAVRMDAYPNSRCDQQSGPASGMLWLPE